MSWRTPPSHWYKPQANAPALFLLPFAWVWMAVTRVRRYLSKPYRAKAKVICIGNVAVGGAGKTPLAIALMDALREAGLASNPCFLKRGYGGKAKGVTLIDSTASFDDYGDEALLLAQHAPTLVSADRRAALQLADRSGFDVAICDDGFQNPYFIKDMSILVFDGAYGVGNGLCVPAGPCREPLKEAVLRAQAAVIVGDDKTGLRDELNSIPTFAAHFKAAYNQRGGRYLAFAGIGRPEKFFETLAASNYDIVKSVPFADHHVYSASELDVLLVEAERLSARLITTEKDHVRLPDAYKPCIDTLPVSLRVDGMPELLTLIRTRLS